MDQNVYQQHERTPYQHVSPERNNDNFEKLFQFVEKYKILIVLGIMLLFVLGIDLAVINKKRADTLRLSISEDVPEPETSPQVVTATPAIRSQIEEPTPEPTVEIKYKKSVSPTKSPYSPTPAPTPGAPDSTKSSFNANPATIPNNGTSKSQITITLKDTNGSVLSGWSVSLSSSDGSSVIGSYATGTNTSDNLGQATFVLSATNTGTNAISVTSSKNGKSYSFSDFGSVIVTNANTPTSTPAPTAVPTSTGTPIPTSSPTPSNSPTPTESPSPTPS